MQWQDMGSKPPIGTLALLFTPHEGERHEGLSLARWDALQYEVAVFSEWGWQEPGTGHTDYGEDWRGTPTAWLPLPPPPTAR